MPENVREVTEQHHAFYEVLPYYIVLDRRPHGAAATNRRIQAGFDVDVYGIRSSPEPEPSRDDAWVYAALQNVVETILAHASDLCSIEVIPFGPTIILDSKRHLQPEAMLRISITHGRGLDQPAGAREGRALREIEEQLHALGVSPGGAGLSVGLDQTEFLYDGDSHWPRDCFLTPSPRAAQIARVSLTHSSIVVNNGIVPRGCITTRSPTKSEGISRRRNRSGGYAAVPARTPEVRPPRGE